MGTQAHTADSDIHLCAEHVHGGRKNTVAMEFLKITAEGLEVAVFMAIRLVLLLMGSSMLTLCTRPLALTDGIEGCCRALRRWASGSRQHRHDDHCFEVHSTLLEEADKIMKSSTGQSIDFESGGLMKKNQEPDTYIGAAVCGAFRIAQDLAMAMEARCYRGGENRTRMNEMKFGRDYAAIVMMVLFLAVIIIESRLL